MSKKDRVKGLKRIAVADLQPHPLNYRVHGEKQSTLMSEMLENIGMAGALLVYKHGSHYRIIDGHLRASLHQPTDRLPCLELDITEEEANKLLATYDNITGMADLESNKFAELTDLLGEDIGGGNPVVVRDKADEPKLGRISRRHSGTRQSARQIKIGRGILSIFRPVGYRTCGVPC